MAEQSPVFQAAQLVPAGISASEDYSSSSTTTTTDEDSWLGRTRRWNSTAAAISIKDDSFFFKNQESSFSSSFFPQPNPPSEHRIVQWKARLEQAYRHYYAPQCEFFLAAIHNNNNNNNNNNSRSSREERTNSCPRLVLLSGPSSLPQRALAKSILCSTTTRDCTTPPLSFFPKNAAAAPQALYESSSFQLPGGHGKFHPSTRSIPYHAIVTALEDWLSWLLLCLDEQQQQQPTVPSWRQNDHARRVRQALQTSLSPAELRVLRPVLSPLASILEHRREEQEETSACCSRTTDDLSRESSATRPDTSSEKTKESNNDNNDNKNPRFILALCHFLRVIAKVPVSSKGVLVVAPQTPSEDDDDESSSSSTTTTSSCRSPTFAAADGAADSSAPQETTTTTTSPSLVLVLEDLHHADPCSLDLLATLLADQIPLENHFLVAKNTTNNGNDNLHKEHHHHNYTSTTTTTTTTTTQGSSGSSTMSSGDGGSSSCSCSAASAVAGSFGGLVIVATCDDAQVTPDSYVADTLRNVEAEGINLYNITLPLPSSPDHVREILTHIILLGDDDESNNQKNDNDENQSTTATTTKTNSSTTRMMIQDWVFRDPWWLEIFQHVLTQSEDGIDTLATLLAQLEGYALSWSYRGGPDHSCPFSPLLQAQFLRDDNDDDGVVVDPSHIQRVLHQRRATTIRRWLDDHGNADIWKVACALGYSVDGLIIAQMTNRPIDQVMDVLEEAVENGILQTTRIPKRFVFASEPQFAQLTVTTKADQDCFHAELGYSLWNNSVMIDQVDQNLFLILSQVMQGRSVVLQSFSSSSSQQQEDALERRRAILAQLCLQAGRTAVQWSAFRRAIAYLNFGIQLLPRRTCWRDHYDLTVALYSAAAELELFQARFEDMQVKLDHVFANVRNVGDAVHARGTQLLSLSIQDKQQECLEVGMELLRALGEPLPKRMIIPRLIMEIQAIEKLLKGKTDKDLQNLPMISDPDKLHALTLLQFMILPAVNASPKLAPLIMVKCFRITLQYGQSQFAAHAFAMFGMVVQAGMGDTPRAARFANLGWNMWETSGIMEYMPRVASAKYGCVHLWSHPFRDGLEPLYAAYKMGTQLGDFEYASLCGVLFTFQALEAGIPLDKILQSWTRIEKTIASGHQHSMLFLASSGIQCIHHLMGMTPDPLSPQGDLVNYDEMEKKLVESGVQTSILGLRFNRMRLAYLFGNMEMTEKYALTIGELHMFPPAAERGMAALFLGLFSIQKRRSGCGPFVSGGRKEGGGGGGRGRLTTAKKSIKLLRRWADDSPTNFADKLHLVEAELAAVQGKPVDVIVEKYQSAIVYAHQSQSFFMVAFGNEHLAKYHARGGRFQEARSFFVDAVSGYGQWAAYAKQAHLKKEVAAIYGEDLLD